MVQWLERVRITEHFDVIQCSPKGNNDGTVFTLNWDCPAQNNNPCDTDTARRYIKVESSDNPMVPTLEFQPALVLCGNPPSDIILHFRNPGPDAGKLPGSNMKSLHKIFIEMKQDVFVNGGGTFPLADICLENGSASDQAPVDPSAPKGLPMGFYTYSGTAGLPANSIPGITHAIHPYTVVLDFDVLNGVNLTGSPYNWTSSPLVNGFIPDNVFNELNESKTISLRFKGASFDCTNARFYHGESFTDWPKPAFNRMFFGDGINNYYDTSNRRYYGSAFDFYYDNMCQDNTRPQTSTAGNYFNDFPVTAFAEADKTDVVDAGPISDPRRKAVLDFYWQYSGGRASPSPFNFNPYGASRPYFDCVDTYQAEITIPTYFQLNSASYFSDPNKRVNPVNLTLGTPQLRKVGPLDYYVYTTGDILGMNGRLSLDVTLTNCPPGTGDFTTFTVNIQALCKRCLTCPSCLTCPYTVARMTEDLYFHCRGNCDGGPPQGTYDFLFNRVTLGWDPVDPAGLSVPVTTASPILTNRAYKCDEIALSSHGFFDAGDSRVVLNPNSFPDLYFGIDYPPGVDYQFFEFVSGSIEYGKFDLDANGDPLTTITYGAAVGLPAKYPITTDDLSDTVNALNPASKKWPLKPNNPPWPPIVGDPPPNCTLWVNIPHSDFDDIKATMYSSVQLKLEMVVRVRPMADLPAGYYDLSQIRAGFYIKEPSCDTRGDNMNVLNVLVTNKFQIYPDYYGLPGDLFFGPKTFNGVCLRSFLFSTTVKGGLPAMDDFPNELRPVAEWPGARRTDSQRRSRIRRRFRSARDDPAARAARD